MRLDFVDGVEPAPLRTAGEKRMIDRADARRARGDYNMKIQRNQPSTEGASRIEDGPAWAIYQDQLARGLGEGEDF